MYFSLYKKYTTFRATKLLVNQLMKFIYIWEFSFLLFRKNNC